MMENAQTWQGQIVSDSFRLKHYLGGTEGSVVYLAERIAAGAQQVAIKFVPEKAGTGEPQLQRWYAAAELSHPHLIKILEAGRCPLGETDWLYVVTEYAEEDLTQVLPQRPLTADESRDILCAAVQALDYLHSNGWVHGHLKPANIMAVADQLKISSDGIRRAGERKTGTTQPNAYSAPETMTGAISPAADAWSLGMVLVEAMTQHPASWNKAENEEPVVPETLPPPLFEIARNCLRVDPRQRWTTRQLLERLDRGAARQAEPDVAAVRGPASVPQKAKWRYATALAFVIGLAALLVGWILNRDSKPGPAPASHTPTQVAQPEVGGGGARRSSPTAREKAPPSPGLSPPQNANGSKSAVAGPEGISNHGAILHQVIPEVPSRARDTIQGTVRVTVRVTLDPSGNVSDASLESRGPSQYFANLALQAARGWKFAPPEVDGGRASREWILRFEFQRTGTRVLPQPAGKP